MKKHMLILAAIAFSVMVFAQQKNHEAARVEVETYLQENVVPELIKQQESYMTHLSNEEVKTVEQYRERISQFKAQRKERSGKGKGKGQGNNRGNGKGEREERGKRFEEQRSELENIASNHPQAAEAYQNFIDSNTEKWKMEIDKILVSNDVDPENARKSGGERHERLFERLKDPVWLMLWDPDSPMIGMRRGHGSTDRGGRFNEELRTELRTYMHENIFPVIAEERSAFDQYLTDNEKSVISNFRSAYKPSKGKHGKGNRPSEADRTEISNIAEKYDAEIQNSLDRILTNKENWESDIQSILDRYPEVDNRRFERSDRFMGRAMRPVGFLLFDPNRTEGQNSFNYLRNQPVPVAQIFPNPAHESARVEIDLDSDQQVTVSLYSKEGERLSTLFEGVTVDEKLIVSFETASLEEGIYILKIDAGAQSTTEKLIVRH